MTPADLFNADLKTIGRMVERGLSWWRDELLALVPERWRRWSGAKARTVVRPEGDGFRFDAALDGRSPAEGPLCLCLPCGAGLLRRLDLPLLPVSDLRRMIALDIDRLTPFETEDVLFDFEIEERLGGRLRVLIGVLPRERSLAAIERLRRSGLVPEALSLADGDGRPRFDFLPATRTGDGPRRGWTASRLWMAAAALLILNLGLFTLYDILSIETLHQRIEAQQPMIGVAGKLRIAVEAERTRRDDLVRRQRSFSPLPVLDGLTRSLPDEVWIQRLEWNGASLRIIGWNRGDADVLALVDGNPLLANVRPVDAAASPKSSAKPFEIVAERKPGGGR
ncbi:PilN domain-containing protein [Telmatospirillum siberiense]|uniref:General secretion pathway protein GspL n=1 Tax=Telmatospirillum siberiense TaxID=382514 RepID=A0A2N3PMD3_9PROT|nr:PilN domain-containing protein [Telmatospirillum siberiense]PKU21571.1 hypothetical protein CWS72_26020 [Telmatospirillum siberiense]